MFLLTSIVMLLIYVIYQGFVALDVSCQESNKKRTSEEEFKWAQEHEDEWIDGTDLIVRENGKLMYYPWGYNRFDSYPVYYGWDDGHFQYGLIHAGQVIFDYEQLQRAKTRLRTNPHRVHYVNGKPLLNLGPKHGVNGDVYKVIGENKYYCYDKEVWMVDEGTCICSFSSNKNHDPKRDELLKKIARR